MAADMPLAAAGACRQTPRMVTPLANWAPALALPRRVCAGCLLPPTRAAGSAGKTRRGGAPSPTARSVAMTSSALALALALQHRPRSRGGGGADAPRRRLRNCWAWAPWSHEAWVAAWTGDGTLSASALRLGIPGSLFPGWWWALASTLSCACRSSCSMLAPTLLWSCCWSSGAALGYRILADCWSLPFLQILLSPLQSVRLTPN